MPPSRHIARTLGNRRALRAGLLLMTLVAGACTSATPSPSPQPTPSPLPGEEAAFRLRATPFQALPPLETFTWTPTMVITDELVAIQPGAITLIFPGPLVNPLMGVQLTEDAWTKIVSEARNAGLLSGETDFSGGGLPPGAQSARLQLVVDGRMYDMTGDPNRVAFCGDTLCPAEPGSPEAFATFLSLLGDLRGWIGDGVGAQADWRPTGYAVLVGPPPADDQGLDGQSLAWPFEAPAPMFGAPVSGDPDRRCGSVTGDEATAFEVQLRTANQLTTWRDPAVANELGLTVRPLLPGDEDPCAPLTGA